MGLINQRHKNKATKRGGGRVCAAELAPDGLVLR